MFMKKSQKQPIVKNNPGWDRPVYFWFRIPKESRVCPMVQNQIPDAIENPT